MELSYVLPLRCEADHCDHGDLRAYVADLATLAEVIVADGSPPPVFAEHARMWPRGVRHLPPDPGRSFANGKVDGVTTGVRVASFEMVVLADDDVRYRPAQLRAIAERLRTADLVIPQNVFEPATTWHARWDTARTLLNRAVGHDYPGTLAVRRSTFHRIGGYDGDVLFENLELIRTVRAHGGVVTVALDVVVPRRPPTTRAFIGQRVRQAYDDLGQPVRLCAHLAMLPAMIVLTRRRRWGAIVTAAAASVGLAEIGRRRKGGLEVFPASASWFAPAWLLERAIVVWFAVGSRALRGGCRYRGVTLRRAATPMRELRRRAATEVQRGRVERAGTAACVPSHNGLVRDRPQRHSATTSRLTSSSSPSSSTTRTGPRTR